MDENILTIVRKHLVIKEKEKKKYGEVFTPVELIYEMLDKLPEDIWTNPNLKWLDPANGIGNFPIVVYYKLMKGLEEWKPDNDERSKYIIENMLYMVELNPVNCKLCRKIFKMINPEATPNIFNKDFLEWSEGRSAEFDIIIGNPPWNKQKSGIQSGSRAKNSLWDEFIIRSFKVLKPNGFLGSITPSQWRAPKTDKKGYKEVTNLLKKHQILYLHIYSKKDGQTFFKVSQRFDLYLLSNKPYRSPTKIIDEQGNKSKINLSKMNFIPNYSFDKFLKILATPGDEVCRVIMSYSDYFYYLKKIYKYPHMSQTKKGSYKYPVIHSIANKPDKITYIYTNDNTKSVFNIPKIILSFNEKQYSYPEQNDYLGNIGMSQIVFGIEISSKKEGNLILDAIKTEYFKNIIAASKWGAFQTNHRMFKYFKKDFYKIILEESKKSKH